MNHYFINDPDLKHSIKNIKYYYNDLEFDFITDSGIFSPEQVDSATDLLLKKLPSISGTLLDLGCGYGVIGIVLSKLNSIDRLVMADINKRALGCAEKNCSANNINAEIINSDSFGSIERCFKNIVLNPPIHAGKPVIENMYRGAYEHLDKNGAFYIVIQEKHGAKSSLKLLRNIFDETETIYKNKGYYIIKNTKIK